MSGPVEWLFAPSNASAVGVLGLGVGVLGTLCTVVGFGLTIWQLMRTANATRAAADAVAAIKSKVATYDAVFEIARATSALRETERHLKIRNWQDAVTSYSEARNAIVRLVELPSALDVDWREKLDTVLNEVIRFSDKFEGAIQRDRDPTDISKAIISNRRHTEILTRVGIFIEGANS